MNLPRKILLGFFLILTTYVSINYFPDADSLILKNNKPDTANTGKYFSILNFSLFNNFEEKNSPSPSYGKSYKNVFIAKLPFSSSGWARELLPMISFAEKYHSDDFNRVKPALDIPTIIYPFHYFW